MSKARTKYNNPIDVLYSQKLLYFEFIDDFQYNVLIDTSTKRVKIEMPNGSVYDEEFEYFFEEDDLYENHDDFEQWFKALLMSVEFFHSDLWYENKKS